MESKELRTSYHLLCKIYPPQAPSIHTQSSESTGPARLSFDMAWSRHVDVVEGWYHSSIIQLIELRTLWLCWWLSVIHVRQRNVWRLMFDLSNQPWRNHPSVCTFIFLPGSSISLTTRRIKEAPNRIIKLVIHLLWQDTWKDPCILCPNCRVLLCSVSSLKKTRPEQSNCPNCTSIPTV